jgi:transposase
MKAYSQDLRERVLRAVDLGRPRAEVVQLFGVSLATIKRYLCTTTRGRAYAAQSDSWSSSEETGTGGGRCAAPITDAR